jgi:Tol biopolymer transport system component
MELTGEEERFFMLRRFWFAFWLVTATLGAIGSTMAASPARVVSARAPGAPMPAGGNGDSAAPVLSPDGHYVLFVSAANNLTTNDNSQPGLDVFLRDRANNTTVLVSANWSGNGGGNGNSTFAGVSTNGRYVVFESTASDLVPGDTNGASDVFVRDLVAGTTVLVSVAANGGPGNGASTDAVMTPDGRYVAFLSAATNLVAGDTNQIPDVFVRDLVTHTTLCASVGAVMPLTPIVPAGFSSVSLTPDGRYVAFCSSSAGLAPGVTNRPLGEVYIRDLVAGSTTWASSNAAPLAQTLLGLQNVPSSHPALSDDGRFVAFKIGSTNGAGQALLLRYDASSNAVVVVSTNAVPAFPFSDDVFGPEMTPDGRFIAFARREGPTNTLYASVHVWDGQTSNETLVSADGTGAVPTNTLSHTPVLTPDGRFVAFLSDATALVGNTLSNGLHIYLRDTLAGATQLLDADTNGVGSTDDTGGVPSLSADGTLAAFASPDGNLVPLDQNGYLDVFLRYVTNATTELISSREPSLVPQTGDRASGLAQISLSADGRWAAFASDAADLIANDQNHSEQVFVHDLAAGSTTLVSAGTNGLPGLGGGSFGPVISGDGRFVVFLSSATNLVASPFVNPIYWGQFNIFRRDLQAGTNVLVTLSFDQSRPGQGDSPVISQDSRYVAFVSTARNLVPGTSVGTNSYWCDINSGVMKALTSNAPSASLPSMSGDGRYVAYFSGASQVSVWDAQAGTNVYTTPTGVGSAAINPTGTLLAYQASGQLYVADVAGQSNRFSFASAFPLRPSGQWSGDGRFLAFITRTNLVAADQNGTNDVYLCDTSNGALTLVSLNSSLTGSAAGPSDWPVVNSNGGFVVYRSFATNILNGITNVPALYVFSRSTASNFLLSLPQSVPGWISWVSMPSISADGGTVSFQSWTPGWTVNDLNRAEDAFAAMVDSDSDGIPDWWMLQFFGHPTGQAADHSRAQDDFDGDGMANLQEFLAGTDPTNPNSVFRIQVSFVSSTNAVLLSWPASASRNYRVQFNHDLSHPAWLDALGPISVIAGQGYFSAPADQASRFYRVVGND